MNPKLIAVAISAVVLMCRPHLTVATAGVGFSVPLLLVAALGVLAGCLVMAVLIVRSMHRCYPHPRFAS